MALAVPGTDCSFPIVGMRGTPLALPFSSLQTPGLWGPVASPFGDLVFMGNAVSALAFCGGKAGHGAMQKNSIVSSLTSLSESVIWRLTTKTPFSSPPFTKNVIVVPS